MKTEINFDFPIEEWKEERRARAQEEEKSRAEAEERKTKERLDKAIRRIGAAALVATTIFSVKAEHERKVEEYKTCQERNIAESEILSQYGVDYDDISFDDNSMEFSLGKGTTVKLETYIGTRKDGTLLNQDGGYYKGEAVRQVGSQIYKTNFKVEQPECQRYVDGIPSIDEACNVLGIE